MILLVIYIISLQNSKTKNRWFPLLHPLIYIYNTHIDLCSCNIGSAADGSDNVPLCIFRKSPGLLYVLFNCIPVCVFGTKSLARAVCLYKGIFMWNPLHPTPCVRQNSANTYCAEHNIQLNLFYQITPH